MILKVSQSIRFERRSSGIFWHLLREGADPQKTAMICLFHDMGEARINDLHRVAKRYIDVGNREAVAFEEQAERPPQPLAGHVVAFIHEYERRTSIEGQLAHDADLLECVIQPREYQAQGPIHFK